MSSENEIFSEEVIDEQHFVVEFAGLLGSNLLNDQFHNLNFIGIETDKPILQIQNTMFKGTFEPFLGTGVCFQQQSDSSSTNESIANQSSGQNDLPTNSDHLLQYVAKCDKRLLMKRIYLEAKQQEAEKEKEQNLSSSA